MTFVYADRHISPFEGKSVSWRSEVCVRGDVYTKVISTINLL